MWLLAFCVILFIPLHKPEDTTITILDVGQGDGIYIRTKDNVGILIDCGSLQVKNLAEYRLVPFLKEQGKDDIDYVMLTHMDEDHISGVMELLEQKIQMIKIHHIILPAVHMQNEAYDKIIRLANQMHIPISFFKTGNKLGTNQWSLTCLHPDKNYVPDSQNAYSMTLLFTYREFDMLLTGDLEEDGEHTVTKELKVINRKIEVLKVAHHGSKYSSTEEFLMAVKPTLSVISSGKNNFFGHPHKEVIARLKQVGSKILNTKDHGYVQIKTDGKSFHFN